MNVINTVSNPNKKPTAAAANDSAKPASKNDKNIAAKKTQEEAKLEEKKLK